MKFDELLKKFLRDKKFREEYERYDLSFEVSELITEARIKNGWTQEKLAKKVGTKQPSIARIERGNKLPSLEFLNKIMDVAGLQLRVYVVKKGTKIKNPNITILKWIKKK